MSMSFMGEYIRVFWEDHAGPHSKIMHIDRFDDWYHRHRPIRMVIEGKRHDA